MKRIDREQELFTLKTIAETINQSVELQSMLDAVLRKLLEVTSLQAGWVFLMEERPHYVCAAHCGLPPALSWAGQAPMRSGSCWCVDRYWDGRLDAAVNILNCKRIEDAIAYKWGDTAGITHHATIPLRSGGRLIGILNVASPGKKTFDTEELTLLQSVALQLGSAIERLRMQEAERKRAETLARVSEIGRALGRMLDPERIPAESVRQLGGKWQVDGCAYLLPEPGNCFSVRARYDLARQAAVDDWFVWEGLPEAHQAWNTQRTMQGSLHAEALDAVWRRRFPEMEGELVFLCVPILLWGETVGMWLLFREKPARFDEADEEGLQSLAEHLSLALENARLYERRREVARWEERNRLARDLHDSVSQMLFSLSLTAGGLASMIAEDSPLAEGIRHIQELATSAHREMRGLILQLRPAGMEQGLATGLQQYGASLGLHVKLEVENVLALPRQTEEALWRCGQEALNNVVKHAEAEEVLLILRSSGRRVMMEIADNGKGFAPAEAGSRHSFGMTTMRERVESVGGHLLLHSKPGSGTIVRIEAPLTGRAEGELQ